MKLEGKIESALMNTFEIFGSVTEKEADEVREKIRANHQLEIEYKENTLKSLNTRYNGLQRQLDILYDDRLAEKITQKRWKLNFQSIQKLIMIIRQLLQRLSL